MNTKWQFESEYHHLSNTAANRKGSIHDDEPARKLGFKGAFVPGSVVGAYACTAVVNRWGSDWFESGWYDFNFVSPVYTSDQVRVHAVDIGDNVVECRILDEEERLCCLGRAGLGKTLPWAAELTTAARKEETDLIFPDARPGTQFKDHTVTIGPEDVEPLLEASCDRDDIWRSYIHPEHLMPIALRMCDFKMTPVEGIRPPGMWAQHALVQYGALPYGTYRFTEHLAAKGASGRTHFLDFQFHVYDTNDVELAVGRHKCKFILDAD